MCHSNSAWTPGIPAQRLASLQTHWTQRVLAPTMHSLGCLRAVCQLLVWQAPWTARPWHRIPWCLCASASNLAQSPAETMDGNSCLRSALVSKRWLEAGIGERIYTTYVTTKACCFKRLYSYRCRPLYRTHLQLQRNILRNCVAPTVCLCQGCVHSGLCNGNVLSSNRTLYRSHRSHGVKPMPAVNQLAPLMEANKYIEQ